MGEYSAGVCVFLCFYIMCVSVCVWRGGGVRGEGGGGGGVRSPIAASPLSVSVRPCARANVCVFLSLCLHVFLLFVCLFFLQF